MKSLAYHTPNRTERIAELQSALALRCSLMSEQMIADWLFAGDVARTKEQLEPFVHTRPKQLCTRIVYAQEIPLEPPVAQWSPGRPLPDYASRQNSVG